MKDTKNRILESALNLLNEHGLPNVTMRQIAVGMQISQGNLTYHFKRKEEIIEALYFQLFEAAAKEHAAIGSGPITLEMVCGGLRSGIETLYTYRFLMIDLNQVMREYPKLHAHYISIQEFRSTAYLDLFALLIENGIFRTAEFENEYEALTERIRLFGDYWLASCDLYRKTGGLTTGYGYLRTMLDMFYPYLTPQGKRQYRQILDIGDDPEST